MINFSFLYLLILFIPQPLTAQEEKRSYSAQLFEKKFYYSALNEFFHESYAREVLKSDLKFLEGILYFTGIELLEDYDSELLRRYPTSSTRFILGKHAFEDKNYKEALGYLGGIHPKHRYYPEGKLLEAFIMNEEKNRKARDEAYERCLGSAQEQEEKSKNDKIKRYYRMIFETCMANKARHYFKLKEYKQALEAFNKIDKRSYKWPYILLEKAWIYYHLGDYNRTLGLLTTYKSPLLENYFFPEGEYLAALSYSKLCLYQDSLTIIEQFHNVYRPRFQELDSLLKKNQSSDKFFIDLITKKQSGVVSSTSFIKHLLARIKKQTRFSFDFNTIYKVRNEIKRIEKGERIQKQKKLLEHLSEILVNLEAKINYNVKNDIIHFLAEIPFVSQELFKLNLEIISRKKDLVYAGQKLISERVRGDYSNLKRSRFEYFWKFEGAFWADELGDYSLGLKSNCKIVKNEIPVAGD
jgi:hypothetical protein